MCAIKLITQMKTRYNISLMRCQVVPFPCPQGFCSLGTYSLQSLQRRATAPSSGTPQRLQNQVTEYVHLSTWFSGLLL